jgi:Protein of unknown function (DUF3313)
MTPTNLFLAITLATSIAGCSTMSANQSGFLSHYPDQKSDSSDTLRSSLEAATALIDPSRVKLGEVEWRATASAEISAADQAHLLAQLHTALEQRIHELPPAPGGHAVTIRAAITRVETISPPLNVLSTLAVFVPLEQGGAAVEIEAVDSDTGQQYAVLKQGYFAPPWKLAAQFRRLGPAEVAIRKASVDFASALHPVGAQQHNAAPALASMTAR